MSGLAGLLAGHFKPGVYHWHAAFHAPDVQHSVEHAHYAFGHVDSWLGSTKQEFLEAIGRALGFPEHYGRNFDALVDCLRDVGGDQAGVVLLWDGWGALAREDEKSFRTALDILQDRAGQDERKPFTVLLRGEGPELPGIASLD